VDGASALLHLVRASLHRDAVLNRSRWIFDPAQLKEADSSLPCGRAAVEVLLNCHNLNLPIRVAIGKDTNGRSIERKSDFRSRVEEIVHFLEILIDYEAEKADREGIWLSTHHLKPGQTIVGYDFCDIATRANRVEPRLYRLKKQGWVKFIRSIKATIIFGDGFGELLKPRNLASVCPRWTTIPQGIDYLATSVAVLKRLQAVRSETNLEAGEITSRIFWTSKSKIFGRCPCLDEDTDKDLAQHIDPVQLLSCDMKKGLRKVNVQELDDQGAVVFGQRSAHLDGHGGTDGSSTASSSFGDSRSPSSTPAATSSGFTVPESK